MSLINVSGEPPTDPIERKRQYNREYYQKTIKPKRQLEKKISKSLVDTTKDELMDMNSQLVVKINLLERELLATKQALNVARKQNYELMLLNAERILPDLRNVKVVNGSD